MTLQKFSKSISKGGGKWSLSHFLAGAYGLMCTGNIYIRIFSIKLIIICNCFLWLQ